jgi:hypothetical protein
MPLFRELAEEKIYDNMRSFQELKGSNAVENTGISRQNPVACSEIFSEVQRPSWKLQSTFLSFSVK